MKVRNVQASGITTTLALGGVEVDKTTVLPVPFERNSPGAAVPGVRIEGRVRGPTQRELMDVHIFQPCGELIAITNLKDAVGSNLVAGGAQGL